MPNAFLFFDLGQTIIDEWQFIQQFDYKFLELLNGFGARIDRRAYAAVRDSIIRDRLIGYGSIKELIIQVSKLVLPIGYDSVILNNLESEIIIGRKQYFRIFEDAMPTLQKLYMKDYGLGVIANQSSDIVDLLHKDGIVDLLSVRVISSEVRMSKPDLRIFEFAIDKACKKPADCVMIGDRLDTDIAPAKKIGMKTIRTTNSLFSLQEPRDPAEIPDYTVSRLAEIPEVLNRIIG